MEPGFEQPDNHNQKSLVSAYVCWLFGGLFGLHHLYLGRDRQAVISFCTLGGCLLGLLYDLYKMPFYVNEANEGVEYAKNLNKMQFQLKTPAFLTSRFLNCLLVGTFITYIVNNAIPLENDESNFIIYRSILIISPLIEAFIIYYIGTDGPMECEFRWPLLGSLLSFVMRYSKLNESEENKLYYPLLATFLLNWNIRWDKNYLAKKKLKKEKLPKRIFKYVLLTGLFLTLICVFSWNNLMITSKDGTKLTLKETATKYFNSDRFKEIKHLFSVLWNFYKAHGFWKLIDHIIYDGDGQNISNAYATLGLSKNSSEKKINQACKTLSRKWHPDRYKVQKFL